jgi:hypothetical protein
MPVPINTIHTISKKGINKKAGVLIIILITIISLKFLVFDFVVPKTAAFTMPYKWKTIPLRQTKEIVRGYFGEPLPAQNALSDKWANGSKGKMYFLQVYYINDTIASAYSIHYQYKNWFGSRDYLIDSNSLR